MMKAITLVIVLAAAMASPAFVQATEVHGKDCASCHTLSNNEASALLKRTGGSVKSIMQSQVRGMFELLVEKDGRQGVIYVDYAKKHLIQGLVINLETLLPVSSHQSQPQQQKQVTSIDPRSIPVGNALVMGNPRGTKKLYVFTDPDCPYCRSFHRELKKLVQIAPDVSLNIILNPLPMHPVAYDKARVLLESKSTDLLDKAFEGQELPQPVKDDSKKQIDDNIRFANDNGLTGTPTLVMPDGKVLVGMRDAETLKKILEGKQ